MEEISFCTYDVYIDISLHDSLTAVDGVNIISFAGMWFSYWTIWT